MFQYICIMCIHIYIYCLYKNLIRVNFHYVHNYFKYFSKHVIRIVVCTHKTNGSSNLLGTPSGILKQ